MIVRTLRLPRAYCIVSARKRYTGGAMSRSLRYVCMAALIGLPFLSIARAQSTFGSITGTVQDPAGAVIPAVQIEVINEGTGTVYKAATSSAGVFNVPNLGIGSYRV